MIIPSIDLMNNKAVQLQQGKTKILERDDVLELAKEFQKYGEIAVIDLDAALNQGDNIELIKKILKVAECRVGGGIRTLKKANQILQWGAKKIFIGTKAYPTFLQELPKDRIIVAIDTRNNVVVNEGWTKPTQKTPKMMIKELEKYCSEFLFTNINMEGLMKGIDFDLVRELRQLTKNEFTVAGGITNLDEIRFLEKLNCNSQIGMAIYTGRLNLMDAFIAVLDFKKNNGLIPTIVQEKNGQVLMLAYSSKESLKQTFQSRKATYYSRTREKIWIKGETSNNHQELIYARYDCDKDTILFKVKQHNFACHLGRYSCFEQKNFTLNELFDVINSRLKVYSKDSYTSQISQDEEKIKAKILEETKEILNYTSVDNLIWEIADLTYFILVLMAKKGISLNDIKNELWRRRK